MTLLSTSTIAEEGVTLTEWPVASDIAGESSLVYPGATRSLTDLRCVPTQESL